jgi:hypothetical protein
VLAIRSPEPGTATSVSWQHQYRER